MRRSLLSAGLGLTLTGLLAMPALAAPNADPMWATIDAGSFAGSSHDRIVLPGARLLGPSDARAVDVRPDDRPDHDLEHDLEQLRLACHGRTNDEGRAAVGCEWSATGLERAAGYRLERYDGDAREVIFRTDDLTRTTFVDTKIRPGVRYIYRVAVLDADGTTIGVGGPVRAGVEADRELEALQLGCEARDAGSVVGCRWESARSKEVAGYQLWRAVDRNGRELVHRGGSDITSYVDDDLGGAHVVHYTVIAVDADGEMIGRSRAVTLRLVDQRVDRPTVRQSDTVRPAAPAQG